MVNILSYRYYFMPQLHLLYSMRKINLKPCPLSFYFFLPVYSSIFNYFLVVTCNMMVITVRVNQYSGIDCYTTTASQRVSILGELDLVKCSGFCLLAEKSNI